MKVKLSTKILLIGLLMLVLAIVFSALALTVTEHWVEVRSRRVAGILEKPLTLYVYRLLPPPPSNAVYDEINITLVNHGGVEVYVTYLHGNLTSRFRVPGGLNATIPHVGYFDALILWPGGPLNVTVKTSASIIRRGLLFMSIPGFISFIVGTILVTLAVVLRLSGVEG